MTEQIYLPKDIGLLPFIDARYLTPLQRKVIEDIKRDIEEKKLNELSEQGDSLPSVSIA